MEQLVNQLRSIPFFNILEQDALIKLARSAKYSQYQAGEAVFWEGEASQGLYWLQSGWLKAVKFASSGREQILRTFAPGQSLNEVGAFTNLPNLASLIALEVADVWLIPKNSLIHYVHDNPQFAQHVIDTMAERLQYLSVLVEDLSLRSVISRLARLILDEAVDDVLLRPRWYTQNELAARLGTVADVIQRALRKLESDGLIQVERDQIRIVNRDTLEQLTQ